VSEYSPHPTRLSLGARSRVFHEDTEEREEILSQRHKDTKIEKPYMASYLSVSSSCLCVFVRASSFSARARRLE
jgi:hypothetical protein